MEEFCDGSCEEHVGEVVVVNVTSTRGYDWGEFHYCEGETKVEGVVVVIKAYGHFEPNSHKLLMAKLVSEEFKEKHQTDWKTRNPGAIERIVMSFNQEAIWNKAIQHLRDAGILVNAPNDIGALMAEIQADFLREHKEFIKDELYKSYKRDIVNGIRRGFPEWYKAKLLERPWFTEYASVPEEEWHKLKSMSTKESEK